MGKQACGVRASPVHNKPLIILVEEHLTFARERVSSSLRPSEQQTVFLLLFRKELDGKEGGIPPRS
jgi:hypothetical protein